MQHRANKFRGIARMLKQRVERGDYALKKLPSEMELADETGVSRMTARKALTHLIDAGVFKRTMHGRLELGPVSHAGKVHQFAFLMPPVISEDIQAWQWAVEIAIMSVKGVLRPIVYTDWNDVLIGDALKGFDGIFLMQAGADIPDDVVALFRTSPNPVVSLDLDLSKRGIPSVLLFPKQAIWRLLDHVHRLGHRNIACLHTCKSNVVFRQRIEYWQLWKDKHGVAGNLYDCPGQKDAIDYGAEKAEQELYDRLQAGTFKATAIICTNIWTALGAKRAIERHGMTVGKEISVCAINDEMLAPWLTPTLTSLRIPDPTSLLGKCVKWMTDGGVGWTGSKLLTPKTVPLFKGDSTGPHL